MSGDGPAHECFYRGCKELVAGRYHCPRHEAILERRRAIQSARNSERAAQRRAQPKPPKPLGGLADFWSIPAPEGGSLARVYLDDFREEEPGPAQPPPEQLEAEMEPDPGTFADLDLGSSNGRWAAELDLDGPPETTSPDLAPTSPSAPLHTTSPPPPFPKGGEVGGRARPTSPSEPDRWHPLDLTELAAAAPEPPAIIGLLYLGRRHLIAGETEAAKTWLLGAAAAEELRAGRAVVWVDGDLVGAGDLLERLRALGLSDTAISSGFLYYLPEGPLKDSAELVEPLQAGGGRLAVLDGFNPLLWLHGCDPDKGAGIDAFMRRVANPLRDAGAAVVLSDNVTKAREGRGAWAIGSERKKSAVEVQIGMAAVEPLGRGRTGKYKLTVHKDRPGYLQRPSPGLFVLASDPDTGRCAWRLEPDASRGEEGEFRPTHLMERVSRYLEVQGEPCARGQVEDDVKGNRDALRTAIDRLVYEEYAVEQPGARGARLVRSLHAYREADEWQDE